MRHPNTMLQGVFSPIITAFDRQERIRIEDIIYNVQRYNETELHGYMPLGSNGEFQGLSDKEALQVLRAVCAHRHPNKLVVGGCGRESVSKTIAFIRRAADIGLEYAFVLPPHYFSYLLTEEGLFRFYMTVADDAPIPIVIYNAPKFACGLSLSAPLVARLAGHPNICAIKNSSTQNSIDFINATRAENFSVIAGNIQNFYEGLRSGAVGGVLSTACYLPEYCCRLYELVKHNDMDNAKKLHEWLTTISAATAGPLGVAGVKYAMQLRGFQTGHVRLPLLDISPAQRASMARVFRENNIPQALFQGESVPLPTISPK